MSNELQVLNEVYFGRPEHLTKSYNALVRFRRKYATDRKIFTASVGCESDPDFIEFRDELAKEFNIYSLSLLITYEDMVNMMTLNVFFREPDPKKAIKVTNKGYKFTDSAQVGIILIMPTGLLLNNSYTDEEIFGVVLHEIGHNFQDYISGNMYCLKNVTNTLLVLSEVMSLLSGNVGAVIKDIFTVGVLSNQVVANLSKIFNNALDNKAVQQFYSLIMFLGSIPKNVLNMIQSILPLEIIMAISKVLSFGGLFHLPFDAYNYGGEQIADKFASYYGFGAELSTGLLKIDSNERWTGLGYYIRKVPIVGHFYGVIAFPFTLISDILECHPGSGSRVIGILDSLENDLNDNAIDPKMKKEVRLELERARRNVKKFVDESKNVENPQVLSGLYQSFILYTCHGDLKYQLMEPIFNHDKEVNKQFKKLKEDTDMRYNIYLEADDEDKKDEEMDEAIDDVKEEKEDKNKSKGTDNDYLGDGSDSSDDSDDTSSDEEKGTDNDYLGDSETSDDESSSSNGEGLYNKLAKVAYAYVVVSNNMHHIHLHAIGRKFKNIHDLAQSFYEHFDDQADFYAELAMQDNSTTVDNFCNAAQYVPEATVETSDKYKYEQAYNLFDSNIEILLSVLKDARALADERSDIQSDIDTELSYLYKQKKYIINRSLVDSSSDSIGESFKYLVIK